MFEKYQLWEFRLYCVLKRGVDCVLNPREYSRILIKIALFSSTLSCIPESSKESLEDLVVGRGGGDQLSKRSFYGS